jgi:hypothetical protein
MEGRSCDRYDSRREAAAFQGSSVFARATRNSRERVSGLAHEKGGVVRRPFSKLQAWLIAVSPQPESHSLSALRRDALSLRTGTERGAAKPPLSVPGRLLRLEEPPFTPR